MDGTSIVGALAALSGVIGSLFAGIALLRRERRDFMYEDAEELAAHRKAWIWAVRIITVLRAMLAQHDLEEPEGLDDELKGHLNRIQYPGGIPASVRDEQAH